MNEIQSQESFLDLGFASQQSNYKYSSINRGDTADEASDELIMMIYF